MDCDKFESAMMDDLYGELDELTSAALKRHVASCAACAGLLEGLRATLRVAAVPPAAPPADLEARILRAAFPASMPAVSVVAAAEARPSTALVVPFGRRAARALSIAGNWAMRPQTAMAAVFLVMIGTSGLLLRGRSSRAPAGAAVTVTEEGTPAPVAPAGGPAADLVSPRMGASPGSTVAAAPPPLASAPGGGLGSLRTSSGGAVPAQAEGSGAIAMNGPSADAKQSLGIGRAAIHQGASPKAAAPRKGAATGSSKGAEGAFADLGSAAPAPSPPDEAVAQGNPAEAARESANFAQPPPASPAPVAAQSAPAPAMPMGAPGAASPPYPAASFDDAMSSYRARRFDDASRTFDALSAGDPRADLWAARAQREGNGCAAAVARFDEVAARAPGTAVGWDAALDGGRCYRFLGNTTAARARLTPLLKVPAYTERARAELSALAHTPASGAASSRP